MHTEAFTTLAHYIAQRVVPNIPSVQLKLPHMLGKLPLKLSAPLRGFGDGIGLGGKGCKLQTGLGGVPMPVSTGVKLFFLPWSPLFLCLRCPLTSIHCIYLTALTHAVGTIYAPFHFYNTLPYMKDVLLKGWTRTIARNPHLKL